MIEVGKCYMNTTNYPWNDVCRIHTITQNGWVHGEWGVGAMTMAGLTIRLDEANAKLASGDWVPWEDPLRSSLSYKN